MAHLVNPWPTSGQLSPTRTLLGIVYAMLCYARQSISTFCIFKVKFTVKITNRKCAFECVFTYANTHATHIPTKI